MSRSRMSRGDQLLLVAVLAAAGVFVAAYLTYEWFDAFRSSICDIGSYISCSAVGTSPYAAVAGIPTSTVGLVGFLLLLVFSMAGLRGSEALGPWSVDTWILALALVGAFVGLGLTFIEIFVIQAICILCAAGFALDLGILAVAVQLRRARSASE